MYSQKMKDAVSSAQSCIDMCCGSRNVAVQSAEYISAFSKFLAVLDPSDIDFLRNGFLMKLRIKNYWKLFSEHYPKAVAIIDKLRQNRIIAENTLMTLRSEQERYEKVLEEFIAEEPAETDIEYLNQRTVALNLKSILMNTVSEYEVLAERLRTISGTAADVFRNAVLIARTNYQINIVSEQSAGLTGTADIFSYKSDYSRLYGMCR